MREATHTPTSSYQRLQPAGISFLQLPPHVNCRRQENHCAHPVYISRHVMLWATVASTRQYRVRTQGPAHRHIVVNIAYSQQHPWWISHRPASQPGRQAGMPVAQRQRASSRSTATESRPMSCTTALLLLNSAVATELDISVVHVRACVAATLELQQQHSRCGCQPSPHSHSASPPPGIAHTPLELRQQQCGRWG